jgi:mutator protein MutT
MKLKDLKLAPPSELKQTNLVLLRRGGELLLAMKKRGFGAGLWNGPGGKVEPGETAEAAARREVREEIGVEMRDLREVAQLTFYFADNLADPLQNIHCTVYGGRSWTGESAESEEMAPRWFAIPEIPYGQMWPDDRYWLPKVLGGEYVRGVFLFGKGNELLDIIM